MKIGIQTWGSDGDINPIIALAGGLADAGFETTLAVTAAERKDYASYAQRLGFHLKPVSYITPDDGAMTLFSEQMRRVKTPLGQAKFILHKMFEPNVPDLYAMAQELVAENDVLIGHFALHPLQLAAAKANKPYLTVTLNHGAIPSGYFPPILVPDIGRFNPLLWSLAQFLLNRVTLPGINRLRSQAGWPLAKSGREAFESPLCNLIAVSPAFCAKPADWGDNQQVTGFLALPEIARPWQMPDSLKQFLEDGPPPVYLTFGSMLGVERDPKRITETTRLLVGAVKVAGCRAIVQSRWESVENIPEDPHIYRIGPTPHSQVFPHCAAVVHHGGAGTTQTTSLYGKPHIIVAHIADQYFWAAYLRQSGVSGQCLDRRSVTPQSLGVAIKQVLDSPDMADRAKKLGEQIASEDGVGNAVAIISRLAGGLGF
jgi:UDP:flavonoid glycosyltransferase YjiC (YdhE family)